MVLTVCFDALGTCFTLEPVIKALEEVMGDALSPGVGRMVIMDWFHAGQRDYTYASITSPPPPPIATILKSTLPRSISFALQLTPSLHSTPKPIPDLSTVYAQLAHLSPSKGLEEGWKRLKEADGAVGVGRGGGVGIVVVTNGARETTEGYIDQAGLKGLVDVVKSCDEVGKGKPFREVYTIAHRAIDDLINKQGKSTKKRGGQGVDESAAHGMHGTQGMQGERWFVAAHMWDLNAARKAGFKTALVLFEQPPIKDGEVDQGWWDIYGGRPDIVGEDIDDVARQILAQQ